MISTTAPTIQWPVTVTYSHKHWYQWHCLIVSKFSLLEKSREAGCRLSCFHAWSGETYANIWQFSRIWFPTYWAILIAVDVVWQGKRERVNTRTQRAGDLQPTHDHRLTGSRELKLGARAWSSGTVIFKLPPLTLKVYARVTTDQRLGKLWEWGR